jgi:asparagine synthase (glutamine-hydrolysing)
MCGIAGVFHFQREAGVSEDLLRRMTDSLRHRGPDDEGYYRNPSGRVGLGFRRLSIVDLAGGHQPMSTPDGRYWIVFNGEIYNHLRIREELESRGSVFRTRSDTEVILEAYAVFGPSCVERFLGMFALAIWDETERRLFLARDRVGIKPLYYVVRDGMFLFASEIKALFQHPDISPRLNRDELARYFTFLCVPPPATLFEGVQKLRAGRTLLLEEGNAPSSPQCYWSPITGASPTSGVESEVVHEVRDVLVDAVKARLMADVPLGVFLSGGVDSSGIVAIMSGLLDRPVETFSVGYKDDPAFNEFENARRTAELFRTRHHEVIIDHEDFRRFLPKLVHHQDEPIADPVCVPLYFVAELARQSGVKVALVGEGADELFFGYDVYNRMRRMVEQVWNPLAGVPGPIRHAATRAAEPFVDLARRDFLRRFREGGEPFLGGAVTFYPEELKQLAPALARDARVEQVVDAFYGEIDRQWPAADFPTRATYLEFMFRLPELLLMRVDKMTMATSVEGRVPFLDHRMVELAFRIPTGLKVKDGVSKYVLKQALREFLPPEIIDRPKVGFHVPVTRWFERVLSPFADETLFDPRLLALEIWEPEPVRRLLERQRRGEGNYGMRIWTLVNFALWYRHWILGESL